MACTCMSSGEAAAVPTMLSMTYSMLSPYDACYITRCWKQSTLAPCTTRDMDVASTRLANIGRLAWRKEPSERNAPRPMENKPRSKLKLHQHFNIVSSSRFYTQAHTA